MARTTSNERDEMSERKENSVLFSLQELRRLEDDRVQREQAELHARSEAERQAREEAERRTRAEAEARKLAEEERLKRIEEDKEAKIREEQLRVEEAERRARVDADMKLKEQRMRLEIQSRAEGRSPVKIVAGVVVAALLVGGILIYRLNAQHEQEAAERQRQNAEQAAALQRQIEEAKVREAGYQKQLTSIKSEMDERLKLAKSEAEREKIRSDARVKQQAIDEARVKHKKGSGSGDQPAKAPGLHVPGKRDIDEKNLLDGF